MDKTQLFESYEDRDDGLEKNGLELVAKFKAAGQSVSYYGGTDRNTGNPIIIISPHGVSFAEAAQNGTVLQLGRHQKPYERAQLIERGIQGGLPPEDAIRLATGEMTYDALDQSLNIAPQR